MLEQKEWTRKKKRKEKRNVKREKKKNKKRRGRAGRGGKKKICPLCFFPFFPTVLFLYVLFVFIFADWLSEVLGVLYIVIGTFGNHYWTLEDKHQKFLRGNVRQLVFFL
jgi:hypothetical protein